MKKETEEGRSEGVKEVAACLLACLLYLPAWEAFMSCHSNENISLCFALWRSPALSCHALLSHGRMRHADSAPSIYGSSKLWLSDFAYWEVVEYRALIGENLLSHSIELLYTEGAESACLIRPWDTLLGREGGREEGRKEERRKKVSTGVACTAVKERTNE